MNIHERLEGSGIVVESPLMREVAGQIERAAVSAAGVLVAGEPGTGRGLVARAIHACGHEDGAPFVTIDASAIFPADAERLTFGVPGYSSRERGRRAGSPEVVYPGSLLHGALGGTVFFRHVEELPVRVQARLATLFRDREFLESPEGEPVPFTARPVAAVDRDEQSYIDEGRVRLDLHRRFAELSITIPPLRERREDIPALARAFISRSCRRRQVAERELDSAAEVVLSAMPWHANAHELSELLEGLVESAPGDGPITLRELLDHVSQDGGNHALPAAGVPLREARARFEREYIAAVVARHHGRIPAAAKTLGIQRTNLYRKLRAMRIEAPRQNV